MLSSKNMPGAYDAAGRDESPQMTVLRSMLTNFRVFNPAGADTFLFGIL
jgi:hypothetical protein